MRQSARCVVLVGVMVVAGCSPEAELVTNEQKASYAIGFEMGRMLLPGVDRMDMLAHRRGLEDALAGFDPRIPPDELAPIVDEFSRSVVERANALMDSLAAKNSEEGAAYLVQNATRDGVTTSSTGLQFEVLEPGVGPTPTVTDRVRVRFRGSLINGLQFDSTDDDGEPREFEMAELIPGWVEALGMMSVGSRYRIVLPTELAYGRQGMGRFVEPMATLIYEIELIEIVQ